MFVINSFGKQMMVVIYDNFKRLTRNGIASVSAARSYGICSMYINVPFLFNVDCFNWNEHEDGDPDQSRREERGERREERGGRRDAALSDCIRRLCPLAGCCSIDGSKASLKSEFT